MEWVIRCVIVLLVFMLAKDFLEIFSAQISVYIDQFIDKLFEPINRSI